MKNMCWLGSLGLTRLSTAMFTEMNICFEQWVSMCYHQTKGRSLNSSLDYLQ